MDLSPRSPSSLFVRADGTPNVPGVDSDWDDWVMPSSLRNWLDEDPLLDWLDLYGNLHGIAPDTERSLDPRTDFQAFVQRKGQGFERVVLESLGRGRRVVRIAHQPADARSLQHATATVQAMASGAELITQAVLWDAAESRFGVADALVRSDVLHTLFRDVLTAAEARHPAPLLEGARWHYRVLEIKYTTLHLSAGGLATARNLRHAVQAWVYNEALGRLQGHTPEAAFLLGRRWQRNGDRGDSALDKLARVERNGKAPLADLARDGSAWLRRVRREGRAWRVLPVPSREELWPNMKHPEDHPWHAAKAKIATELEDLTLLPRVSPAVRRRALAAGITRWTDPRCSAALLAVNGGHGALLDAVIRTNRTAGPAIQPARVRAAEHLWREPAPVEFFVDFETVSDLDDDFSTFPAAGGQPMIFMIGCGQLLPGGWEFRVFTARSLTEPEEGRIIQGWLEHLRAVCARQRVRLEDARLYHWSPAETATLSTAYNSAAARHRLTPWNGLPWVDLLGDVVRAEPVTAKGAFGFGLKAVAKAFHASGLIETSWSDGPTDGLGAMTGAWWCDREARRRGIPMAQLDLMQEIERYNEVDCRVMAEILHWLRRNR